MAKTRLMDPDDSLQRKMMWKKYLLSLFIFKSEYMSNENYIKILNLTLTSADLLYF